MVDGEAAHETTGVAASRSPCLAASARHSGTKDILELQPEIEVAVLPGTPRECPSPTFHVCPPGGRDHLLGFKFPPIPGIPPVRDTLAGRFSAAAIDGAGQPGKMPVEDWKGSLSVLCGEFRRADYHLARFTSTLASLKARRKVAGGPVFGDPEPARALYCEAASYLSAVRTAVDIIVYVAARRSGASETAADNWEAAKAICAGAAPQPSKYDTDDIFSLRQHKGWFERLNLYRNSMLHRGWHEQSFGYFDQGDTALLANDPVHNIMLVPDLEPLRLRARPDRWTYRDRTWLDTLVREIEGGTSAALRDLLQVWRLPVPGSGTLPVEEHPTVFLTVPFVPPIQGQSPPALHVFLSQEAARHFFEHFKKQNMELLGCSFRELRQTTLHGEGEGYLIAYDAEVLGSVAELHLHAAHDGRDHIIQALKFCPSDRNGPSNQTLWFRLPGLNAEAVFVLSHEGR